MSFRIKVNIRFNYFQIGTLQTHARKHNLPIDSLKIDFQVLKTTVIQSDVFDKRSRGMPEVILLVVSTFVI